MTFQKKKNQQGYVALTSVIFMSLLLVTITVVLSIINYYSRYNILESEYKERSGSLAESCVQQALLNLAQNINYTGTVTNGDVVCKIVSVVDNGANKIIKTQGNYMQSITNLQVTVNASNFSILTWQELAN